VGWWSDQVVPRLTDASLKGRELGQTRARACAELHGRVVEIGFGGGLNLRHLPAGVVSLDAVEPSDVGWSLSERRRARSPLAVARIGLDGQAIAAADATYDAALCTFTLCTVPDPLMVLAEVRRVVRPGGTFVFLEHGRSDDPRTRRWQQRLDPWQQRLAGGCHLTRDPVALVERAGMSVDAVETGALPGFSGPAALAFGYLGRARV
jgi:SAM-dependent methyltransferase